MKIFFTYILINIAAYENGLTKRFLYSLLLYDLCVQNVTGRVELAHFIVGFSETHRLCKSFELPVFDFTTSTVDLHGNKKKLLGHSTKALKLNFEYILSKKEVACKYSICI